MSTTESTAPASDLMHTRADFISPALPPRQRFTIITTFGVARIYEGLTLDRVLASETADLDVEREADRSLSYDLPVMTEEITVALIRVRDGQLQDVLRFNMPEAPEPDEPNAEPDGDGQSEPRKPLEILEAQTRGDVIDCGEGRAFLGEFVDRVVRHWDRAHPEDVCIWDSTRLRAVIRANAEGGPRVYYFDC